ncbi:uncharacterized protein LOC111622885 [Centruroides sculpturatus]|uniref:uncharacterized protein LOC111622885 n=1 Tax=Centruroides sculpturatus TaxID=218467 RepID=UPI000C6CD9E8|nr:uncharacterized protein LOC111622885 [Centruroides sculpturatus]
MEAGSECDLLSKSVNRNDNSYPPSQPRKIPNPLNAFMIFSQEYRKQVSLQYIKENNKIINMRLRKLWKSLSKGVKDEYYMKAKFAKWRHRRKYPDYEYNSFVARKNKKIKRAILNKNAFSCNTLHTPTSVASKNKSEDNPSAEFNEKELFAQKQVQEKEISKLSEPVDIRNSENTLFSSYPEYTSVKRKHENYNLQDSTSEIQYFTEDFYNKYIQEPKKSKLSSSQQETRDVDFSTTIKEENDLQNVKIKEYSTTTDFIKESNDPEMNQASAKQFCDSQSIVKNEMYIVQNLCNISLSNCCSGGQLCCYPQYPSSSFVGLNSVEHHNYLHYVKSNGCHFGNRNGLLNEQSYVNNDGRFLQTYQTRQRIPSHVAMVGSHFNPISPYSYPEVPKDNPEFYGSLNERCPFLVHFVPCNGPEILPQSLYKREILSTYDDKTLIRSAIHFNSNNPGLDLSFSNLQ